MKGLPVRVDVRQFGEVVRRGSRGAGGGRRSGRRVKERRIGVEERVEGEGAENRGGEWGVEESRRNLLYL